MNFKKWTSLNSVDLNGKVVAITGSTGGIGIHLCDYIARLGGHLILCDRNKEKASALIRSLESRYGKDIAKHISCDLSDIESVKLATEKLQNESIDYFINNAGAYSIPRHKCGTGYDNVFQINFLSPYYLAKALLPTVNKRGGKVVVVGSIAHNYSKIDVSDVDFSNGRAASKVYGNAKRYLMFSLSGESGVAITHPGIAVTNITAHYPKLIYALIKYPMKLIFMSPAKASLCVLSGIFCDSKEGEWIGPRVLNIWGMPQNQPLNTAKAEEVAAIREISADILDKIT